MEGMITLPCVRFRSGTRFIRLGIRLEWGRSLVSTGFVVVQRIGECILMWDVADIYVVADKEGEQRVLKLHR